MNTYYDDDREMDVDEQYDMTFPLSDEEVTARVDAIAASNDWEDPAFLGYMAEQQWNRDEEQRLANMRLLATLLGLCDLCNEPMQRDSVQGGYCPNCDLPF